MEFQDRNAGEEEFSQAIIENLFLLKDGSVVMGCHVVCGTVHRGDRFYYVDCVGREQSGSRPPLLQQKRRFLSCQDLKSSFFLLTLPTFGDFLIFLPLNLLW